MIGGLYYTLGITLITFASIALAATPVKFLEGQQPTKQSAVNRIGSDTCGGQPQNVTYKIATRFQGRNSQDLRLLISIAPEDFVRDQMTRLARQLNQDFSDKEELYVNIMDDEKIAANVIPGGDSYSTFIRLKRGEYFLNRKRGQEYIAFSTKRGKPAKEVVLNLGRSRPKWLKQKSGR